MSELLLARAPAVAHPPHGRSFTPADRRATRGCATSPIRPRSRRSWRSCAARATASTVAGGAA